MADPEREVLAQCQQGVNSELAGLSGRYCNMRYACRAAQVLGLVKPNAWLTLAGLFTALSYAARAAAVFASPTACAIADFLLTDACFARALRLGVTLTGLCERECEVWCDNADGGKPGGAERANRRLETSGQLSHRLAPGMLHLVVDNASQITP